MTNRKLTRIPQLFRTNNTNFKTAKKFQYFMKLYNVMELYICRNERSHTGLLTSHNATTEIVSCCCALLHLTGNSNFTSEFTCEVY